jgi:LacI family transcriptional regulator
MIAVSENQRHTETGQVTIKTIAEHCNVSKMAVSQALSNTGRLSPNTRGRIVEAARLLGYRPNSIAKTMRSGHFGAVTLLLSSEGSRSWLPEPLLIGIHNQLAQHDLHLSIARLPDEQLHNEQFVPKLLREWASDGLLINYLWQLPQYLNELIDRYRIPAIWLNVSLERDCVHPNDETACQELTQHLIDLGHRDIGFVFFKAEDTAENHYSVGARIRGYETAMHAARLSLRHLGNPDKRGLLESSQIPRAWLSKSQRPTAVVCYSQMESVAVTEAALSLGIRVPEELSITTFGYSDVLPDLLGTTRMELPEMNMGARAVEMLLEKIREPNKAIPAQEVNCRLWPGRTVSVAQIKAFTE